HAAIGITDEYATLLVDIDTDEIQKVSMRRRTTPEMNSVSLDRVVWRGVRNLPTLAAVVSGGNVQMPQPGKGFVVRRARSGRAQKRKGGAVVVTGYNRGKGDCFHTSEGKSTRLNSS